MKDRRVRRMFTLALCLAALAAPFHSRSQETPAPSVIKVLVLVDGYQVSGPLAGLVPITAGDVYSRAVVDQAVKAVYRTGLFSDVRV
jgi:outer membrane protein assembly factor BamA